MRVVHSISLVILTCLTLVAIPAVAAAAPPPPPISYQQHVVARITNSVGDEVLYRRGYWYSSNPGGGFGYDKAFHKHNLRGVQTVSIVVRFPGEVREEGPGIWVHERRFCEVSGHGCRLNSTITVRVVISYGGWTGPGQHGIKTAYCIGTVRCPDWVSYNAFPA